jgi:CoA:oxalate CoA-transferase
MEITTNQSDTTQATNDLPLKGLLVLGFSQFLSGPLATLRLADMGARVIKIERPGQGDLGRTLYLSDLDIDGVNTLFHAINRNKESFAADLKDSRDMERLRRLIARADVDRSAGMVRPASGAIAPARICWHRRALESCG